MRQNTRSRSTERAGFSIAALARRLGIDRRRVRDAIRSGELVASRLGSRDVLILEGDVRSWLARHRVPSSRHAEDRVAEILGEDP